MASERLSEERLRYIQAECGRFYFCCRVSDTPATSGPDSNEIAEMARELLSLRTEVERLSREVNEADRLRIEGREQRAQILAMSVEIQNLRAQPRQSRIAEADAIRAVDDEPELPGPIPDAVYDKWRKHIRERQWVEGALRAVVIATKRGIRERLMRAARRAESVDIVTPQCRACGMYLDRGGSGVCWECGYVNPRPTAHRPHQPEGGECAPEQNFRHVSGDAAFAMLFGTIRQCTECGALVGGGPNRCVRCVVAIETASKLRADDWYAPASPCPAHHAKAALVEEMNAAALLLAEICDDLARHIDADDGKIDVGAALAQKHEAMKRYRAAKQAIVESEVNPASRAPATAEGEALDARTMLTAQLSVLWSSKEMGEVMSAVDRLDAYLDERIRAALAGKGGA